MANVGLRHVALRVRDLKQTEAFYVGVLGFQVAFRHPPSMLFLRTPGANDLLNFVKSNQPLAKNQGLEHIGFKVTAAGLKRMEKKLKASGVSIEGRRGRSAFYISDPNRYQIEFYCD